MKLMNKELFEKLIEETVETKKWLEQLFALEIDLVDSRISIYSNFLFETLLYTYFTEEGIDWIYWWLYEKDGDPELKAYDKYNIEIPSETIDDLWNIVKEYLIK